MAFSERKICKCVMFHNVPLFPKKLNNNCFMETNDLAFSPKGLGLAVK